VIGPYLHRTLRKEYGSHFTFYWRIGRWAIEVNFGRDRPRAESGPK